MVDPAYVYSQLYHVAFQNTMKTAMFFIDRQLQDWTSLKKYTLRDQHRHLIGSSTSSTLTSNSTTSPTHTNNDDDMTQTSSTPTTPSFPTQYYAFLATEPKTKLFHQRFRKIDPKPKKSRPLSMPILPVQPQPPQPHRSQTPPPLYCSVTTTSNSTNTSEEEDPYTRATRKWQNRRSHIILPREEEGREDLPPYHCSVYKMAKVFVKMERSNNVGKIINRRSWRRVYIELWGTVLRIYPLTWFWATVSSEPIYTISLAGAEASRAVDYIKRPWVLRLTGHNGIQVLIQSTNHEDMMSWIESLQSGINISLDLEERPMPKFLTIPPRRGQDTGVLCGRMAELERRRELRRRTQQEVLA